MIGAEAPGFSATAIALTVLADKAATADLALAPSPNLDTSGGCRSAPLKATEPAKASSSSHAAATPVRQSRRLSASNTAAPLRSLTLSRRQRLDRSAAPASNASAGSLTSMTRRQSFWREMLTGKKSTDNDEPVLTASLSTRHDYSGNAPHRVGASRFPGGPRSSGSCCAGSPAAPPAPGCSRTPPVDLATPFAYADFTWMNAVSRNHDSVLDGKYFSGEFRVDTNYMYDYNHPIDHTLDGTTEGTRTGEVVLQELNIGGDFHWDHMQGRILFQIGNDATAVPATTPARPSASGTLRAYRYISEGYAGYHMDVQHGLNIQAGIFMSYIGLFSYYSFDNWAYQPSYVSSNTPWFFNGFRIQWFPTNKLKIEPWLINGWQSYGKYNGKTGSRRTDPLAADREPRLRLEYLRAGSGHRRTPIAPVFTKTTAWSGSTGRIPTSSCTAWPCPSPSISDAKPAAASRLTRFSTATPPAAQ